MGRILPCLQDCVFFRHKESTANIIVMCDMKCLSSWWLVFFSPFESSLTCVCVCVCVCVCKALNVVNVMYSKWEREVELPLPQVPPCVC